MPGEGRHTSTWSDIRTGYRLLPRPLRSELRLLFALTLLGTIAELATISAVIPFVGLLMSISTGRSAWIEDLLTILPLHSFRELTAAATAVLIVAAIVATAVRLQLVRVSQRFAFGAAHHLGVEIQRRMLLQPYLWHVAHNSSEALASIQQVELMGPLLMQLVQGAAAAALTVAIVAFLITINPVATAIPAIALALLYFSFSLIARRRLRANSQLVAGAFEKRIRTIQEGFDGIRDVILYNSQSSVLEEFRRVDSGFARALWESAFLAAAPRYLIEAAGIIIIALVMLALGRHGTLVSELPLLGALAVAAQRLLPLIQQFYLAWNGFATTRSTLHRINERLNEPLPSPHEAARPAPLPLANAIELRDVGFSYPASCLPALRDMSLTIARGSVVALTGRTGSGKSTLSDLLMGLIEPTSGTIVIDGNPLTETTRRAWQRNIAHVPQSVFLIDSTIARNIAFSAPGEEIDPDRIRAATRLAHLDGLIETLPGGFDTRVGERGIRLSGGERQRLAIARALYRSADVLVLDEATSALDEQTEAAVLHAILTLRGQGRTIIAVAHRGAILEACDVIVKLDGGRLIDVQARSDPIAAPSRADSNSAPGKA